MRNLAKILKKIILGRHNWTAHKFDWLSSNQPGLEKFTQLTWLRTHLLPFSNPPSQRKSSDIKRASDSAWHPAIIAAQGKRLRPPYQIKNSANFSLKQESSHFYQRRWF
jgi:hypothetical protein